MYPPLNMGRVVIDGIEFDDLTTNEATSRIVELAKMRDRPRYVCTGNLDHLALASQDDDFRKAYEAADLVVADGTPIVWLSRLGGTPLKERVAGSDLFWTLGKASADVGVTLFFLGGAPGAADGAKAELEKRWPGAKVVGTYCPPFETFGTKEEQDRIVAEVKKANPDVLLVAFGAPKQEKWMLANKERLGVPVSIGVGGSFEMAAGMLKRAPVWMHNIGLEWFYRFSQEPRRLFQRYIVRDMPHLGKATIKTAIGRVKPRRRR
jgi:N-acetylglucosaminyldiphosphoundecaprenol N-acetyl-beta-D-mannosaminyltransferase